MSEWQIDPAGVQGVLNKVSPLNEDLSAALAEDKFEAVFAGLTWGGGVTSAVPEAVQLLMEDQQGQLQAIGNRIAAGMLGIANATIAYNNGNEEMQSNFNREMIEAAGDGDFSYFQQHGAQG